MANSGKTPAPAGGAGNDVLDRARAGRLTARAGETVYSAADLASAALGRDVSAREIRRLNGLVDSRSDQLETGRELLLPQLADADTDALLRTTGLDRPGRAPRIPTAKAGDNAPGVFELFGGIELADLSDDGRRRLERAIGGRLDRPGREMQAKVKDAFEELFVRMPGFDKLPGALGPQLARLAAGLGVKPAAKALQKTSNGMNPQRMPASIIDPDLLKIDGVAGPKTQAQVRWKIRRFGAPTISEALALTGFKKLAKGLREARPRSGALARGFQCTIAPLFPRHDPAKPRQEVRVLQQSINDANRTFGSANPIREDGILGRMTETAFQTAARAQGAGGMARRLGQGLGISLASFGGLESDPFAR